MATLDHVASVVDTSCMLLCRGMPVGSVVGVDAFAVTVPSRDFAGFRLVPPGPHFLYSTSHPDVPRACRFLYLEPRTVHALVWSREDEALVADMSVTDALGHDVDSARRAHLADPTLVVFPNEQHAVSLWRSVTWALSPRTLAALHSPLRAAAPAATAPPRDAAADSAVPAAVVTSPAASSAGSSITWTPVPGVGTGAEPSARTAYAIDTTAALRSLLARAAARMASVHGLSSPAATGGGASATGAMPPPAAAAALKPASLGLIAELQAAFVSFLVGHDLQALEQWKHVTDVLCRCEDAVAGQRVLPHAFDAAAEEPAPVVSAASTPADVSDGVHLAAPVTPVAVAAGDKAAGGAVATARPRPGAAAHDSDAIPDRLPLFACAFATLHAQLGMLPMDFFASSGAGGSDNAAAAAVVSSGTDAVADVADPVGGGDDDGKAKPPTSGRAPAGPFIIASLARLQEVATRHAPAAGAGLADGVRGLVALARDRFSLDIPSPRLHAYAASGPAAAAASVAPVGVVAGAGAASTAAGAAVAVDRTAGPADATRPAATSVPASAAPLRSGEFASMEELLAALREEGGDDDLPTIV